MTDRSDTLPRERLDALNGWQSLRPFEPADGLVPDEGALVLATARLDGEGGVIVAQPIPDTESAGSLGGRSLPRGVAVSPLGDIYLAAPGAGLVLYTRASLPPAGQEPFAPFAPLWRFESDPGDHPLALVRPVDLSLVPADLPPGHFADALVVADAGRDLLVWVDRRQIVARHVLGLPGTPVACAVDPCGRVAVVMTAGEARKVALIDRGAITAVLDAPACAHSVVALAGGSFAVIGTEVVQVITASGRVVTWEGDADVATPALIAGPAGLSIPGHCADMDALPVPHVAVDRAGFVLGTDLRLVSRARRLPRPRSGVWTSARLDGEVRGFAWDRIRLEAEVPPQCRLVVSTCVSDIAEESTTPDHIGPFTGHAVIDPGTPTTLLVQRNKGQFLWLRIEAFGDGTATPAIRGIDIHGPRQSQLSMLPAPFHQDPQSADFLDRFLSVQDAFLSEVLAAFDMMGGILRPNATPADFLSWLGSWFDWRFLPDWSLATRREMIAASIGHFTRRGTIEGLEELLRWHTGLTGPLPMVLEDFRLATGGATEAVLAGEARPIEGGGAHRFTVIVPASVAPTPAARATIERLIEAQKPAHTVFRLIVAEPGFAPATQGLLGVDTILPDSRPPPLGRGRTDGQLQTVRSC